MFQDQNNVEWFHFLPNKPVLSFFLSSKHVFRKRSRRIQRTNTKVKSPNNAMVNRLICDRLIGYIFMEGSISVGGRSSPLFWLFFSLQKCALPCMRGGSRDWFSIAPGSFIVSGFLWHSSKWAHQFAFGIFTIRQGLKCQHVASIPP